MQVYKKLVRDKIPEIITRKGNVPIIRVLSDEEFSYYLSQKLLEEVQEFLTDNNTEELADIYEVFCAILSSSGITFEELYSLQNQKAEEKGKFEKKIFLDSVI